MMFKSISSTAVLLGAGIILASANVALLHAWHQVERDANETLQLKTLNSHLPVGSRFTALRGYDARGHVVSVSFPEQRGRNTVVVVFTPSCSSSNDLWPEWQRRLGNLPDSAFRVVAVDPLSRATPEFLRSEGGFPAETIIAPEAEGVLANRLRATPQMILVNAAGGVVGTWTGAGQITQLTSLAGFSF